MADVNPPQSNLASETKRKPRVGQWRKPLLFLICAISALVFAALARLDASLTPAAGRALFILLFAILLWATEAIPAFAVGLLVIALSVALLGKPEGVFAKDKNDWEQFVVVFGHPLIWLFFGGFVLAAGMEKCGLDVYLAMRLLRRLGGRYQSVLLGTMLATFTLSMCMSNTATTALMLAVAAPLLKQCEQGSSAGKGLVLAIVVSSILGGLGSLISTPPNAIAAAALENLSPPQVMTVLKWMVLGLPPAVLMLVLFWRVIAWWYPDPDRVFRTDFRVEHISNKSNTQFAVVAATLFVTCALWLTTTWHGIPTAAVSLLPIVVFTCATILDVNDVRRLNYEVLFLIAGGLALGTIVSATGLSNWIVQRLPFGGMSPIALALVLAFFATVLANFMSATATANILIPIVVGIAPGAESLVVIAVAFGASCGMCLPVGSPSTAMVYATGRLQIRDLVRVGIALGVLCPLIAVPWLKLCTEFLNFGN